MNLNAPMAYLNFHSMQGGEVLVRLDHIVVLNEAAVKVPDEKEMAKLKASGADMTQNAVEKTISCTQLVLQYGQSIVVQETIEQSADLINKMMKQLSRMAAPGLALPPGAMGGL